MIEMMGATVRLWLSRDILILHGEQTSHAKHNSRVTVLPGRVHFGGALSGRDQNAMNKTVSGLLKVMHPDPTTPIPDADLEWALRLALEVRG
jgi:ATP-dependent Lon protease